MHHNIIKDGALFIADSHSNDERMELLYFLESLMDSPPPQIFLMGDIFDLFIGTFPYLVEKNRKIATLIEELGKKSEVFFFEGNHDFIVSKSIRNIKCIPLSQQPMEFVCNNKRAFLSHGDYDENGFHSLFTLLIRNRFFLFFLHLATFNFFGNWFIKKVSGDLKKKKLCREFDNFDKFIEKKISKNLQNAEMVIEGHYHQNREFDAAGIRYLNVPGFACNQSFYVVEFKEDKINFITDKYKRL